MADFRASERTSLLTQVAGVPAGRISRSAIVQTITRITTHSAACRQDYPGSTARELEFRRAMRLPAARSLVKRRHRSRTFAAAMDDAGDIVER